MKTKPGRGSSALQLLTLAGFVALAYAPSVMASEVGTSASGASGSVALIQPAGVGVTFDVQTQALSSIFISGQQGDPLSLRVSSPQTDFSQTPQTFAGDFGKVIILSNDLVSVNFDQFPAWSYGKKKPDSPAPLIIVAQFN
jgi:hypothetical protein